MKRFVALALAACSPASSVPTTAVCPEGSTWNGRVCAAIIDTTCPAGTQFVSAKGCVAIVVATPRATAPAASSAPPAEGVPRTAWMEHMILNLPPKICSLPYFVQCFKTTNDECNVATTRLTRSCLRDLESTLPRAFDVESGRREGSRVGRCVGTAYELDLRAQTRFVDTPECNDPSRWQ